MLAPEKFNEIETKIYLGDFSKASHLNFVQKYRIKRILRLIHEPINNNIRFAGILYKKIHIRDNENEDILSYFPECFEFIFKAQREVFVDQLLLWENMTYELNGNNCDYRKLVFRSIRDRILMNISENRFSTEELFSRNLLQTHSKLFS
jgi:hypothetical protein